MRQYAQGPVEKIFGPSGCWNQLLELSYDMIPAIVTPTRPLTIIEDVWMFCPSSGYSRLKHWRSRGVPGLSDFVEVHLGREQAGIASRLLYFGQDR